MKKQRRKLTDSDRSTMQEVKELIAWYEAHGANWLLAAEYTLGLRSGELDRRQHWSEHYIMIPRREARRKP